MGLINEKEDPTVILDLLKKNQDLIHNHDSNEISFHLIHKIINYYEDLQNLVKNEKKQSTNGNNDSNNLKKINKTEINQQLERIKKWINMAKTKDNLHRTENEKLTTPQNKSFKRQNTNTKTNQIIEENKINLETPEKTLNKSIGNFTNKEEININIYEYTDCKIERGIKNFYLKNYEKFIERVIKGPPECFRFTSWLILNKIPLDRNKQIFEFYSNQELNEDIELSIIKDIQRSFPNSNEKTETINSKEKSLCNVLKAFSNLDRDIGYCQGMNLIVAFLLTISDFNETDTFYLLISLFSSTFQERGIKHNYNFSIRGMFSDGFPLLLFMEYIFDQEFSKLLPDLKKKFNDFSITYDVWIGKWFQTLFTIVLPFEWCKRLFDYIFVNGIFFQIQFGLGMIILLEKYLMKFEDESDALDYLNKIREIPFNDNKFSDKFTMKELLNKSEKIKIDIKEYYTKYIETNMSFSEDIEKNNIEYDMIDDDEIENKFDFIEYESKEKIIFDDIESIKDLNLNKTKDVKISNFTLLEENKPNKILRVKSIKRNNTKVTFSENYDDEVEENATVGDIDESSIIREFPDDKKSIGSYNFESIHLCNKDNNNDNNDFFKSMGFENDSNICTPRDKGKKTKPSFYKMKSLNPKSKKDLDNFENK
jgi:hypothetical protein